MLAPQTTTVNPSLGVQRVFHAGRAHPGTDGRSLPALCPPHPAAGQHGRGRQDADPERARTAAAPLSHRDLPRRNRPRRGAHAAGLLRQPAHAPDHAPFKDRMMDCDGLNALIGTPELMAQGRQYE